MGVPATEAQIETANSGPMVVNDNNLLVVRPNGDTVLGPDVVGVTHNGDVGMEFLQVVLGPL